MRSGDVEGPRDPDSLILASDLGGTSVDFHDSYSKQQIKLNIQKQIPSKAGPLTVGLTTIIFHVCPFISVISRIWQPKW